MANIDLLLSLYKRHGYGWFGSRTFLVTIVGSMKCGHGFVVDMLLILVPIYQFTHIMVVLSLTLEQPRY